MKRLTKEWHNQYLQVLVCESVQQHYGMEDINEETYAKLYKKAKKRFIEQESQNPIYYDAKADLRRLDRAISSKTTSPDEKERKKKERLTFIYNHKDELENGPKCIFNEEEVGRRFNRKLKYLESIIRTMPEPFLAKRSDPKYLALGYGTRKDITAMKKLAEVTMGVLLQECDVNRCKNERAAEHLPEEVEFDLFTEAILLSMTKDGDDIVLKFFDRTMRLHKAKIIEQEKEEILPYDDDNPCTTWTRVLAIELECDELTTKFQLSFLMENRNEYEEEETWYLTFECDNITATMSKEELEELRKAAELEAKLKEITDGMMFELNHGDDAETMEFVMGKKVVSVPINEISYNFLFEHFEKLLIELQEYYK